MGLKEAGRGCHASLLWSRTVGHGGLLICTALLFSPPVAVVGTSAGRCEVWDTKQDCRLHWLPGPAGPVTQLLLLPRLLRQGGVARAWPWASCLQPGPATHSTQMTRSATAQLAANTTKLVNLKPDWLEVLDYWHFQSKPARQIMSAKRKTEQSYKFFKSKQKKHCLFREWPHSLYKLQTDCLRVKKKLTVCIRTTSNIAN